MNVRFSLELETHYLPFSPLKNNLALSPETDLLAEVKPAPDSAKDYDIFLDPLVIPPIQVNELYAESPKASVIQDKKDELDLEFHQ